MPRTPPNLGAPRRIESEAFDIEAKAADGFANAPTGFSDPGRLMLRALLAERFGLVVRQARRAIPVYALTLARKIGRAEFTPDARTGPSTSAARGDDTLAVSIFTACRNSSGCGWSHPRVTWT